MSIFLLFLLSFLLLLLLLGIFLFLFLFFLCGIDFVLLLIPILRSPLLVPYFRPERKTDIQTERQGKVERQRDSFRERETETETETEIETATNGVQLRPINIGRILFGSLPNKCNRIEI